MRIWTLHPKYLDVRGLVALWREGLLAQAVLSGKTVGYANHPQLARFRKQPSPVGSIADYLREVHAESVRRGYHFAVQKISGSRGSGLIETTGGQLRYEWEHLISKLRRRSPESAALLTKVRRPLPHPLFRIVPGDVEAWEKIPENE